MLTYEAALERLLSRVRGPRLTEPVSVDDALGRHLAEAPSALVDLPPFDNASMDGWAVRSGDLQRLPADLGVQGCVQAGGVYPGALEPGQAIRIFTGSPLPDGADAVVPQEDCRETGAGRVRVLEGGKPWENVRFRGEDVRRGTSLVPAGTRLGPGHLALLSAAGISHVRAWPRVRVALLPNGSELVPPGRPLPPGGIYESNGVALAALVAGIGAEPQRLPPPADDLPALRGALRSAFQTADLVVTAGGASVGEHDLVKPALESLGGTIDFWRIALKPGKPFFFGTLPGVDGRPDQHLLGVPGNPVSAFVTTVLLVLPVLRRLQGATDCAPPTRPGELAEALGNPEDRRHFVRVRVDAEGRVRSCGPQGSHFLGGLAASDGLVDLPPRTHLPAGSRVRVWHWGA